MEARLDGQAAGRRPTEAATAAAALQPTCRRFSMAGVRATSSRCWISCSGDSSSGSLTPAAGWLACAEQRGAVSTAASLTAASMPSASPPPNAPLASAATAAACTVAASMVSGSTWVLSTAWRTAEASTSGAAFLRQRRGRGRRVENDSTCESCCPLSAPPLLARRQRPVQSFARRPNTCLKARPTGATREGASLPAGGDSVARRSAEACRPLLRATRMSSAW